tara:strand:+ start:1418 stop:1840 length:423 start_codon:yes stop_codon:yes gene_type:complete
MDSELSINIFNRSIKRYISLYGDSDICNECHNALLVDSCNKCGNGICESESCSIIFPDKYNKQYYICRHCFDDISKNLHLLIDMGKIELIKTKIKEEKTNKHLSIQRRNSSCSNSSSMISSISSDSINNSNETIYTYDYM